MIIFGLVGIIVLLFAWVFEVEESVRNHKTLIDLRFAFMYLIANSFLIIYSYRIGDPIFFWLQISLSLLVSFEIFYSILIKKVHKN